MIIPHTLPRLVQVGVAVSLELDILNDAGTQQTASAATVTIRDGDEVLVSAASATTLGPPAAYTLTAAATQDSAGTNRKPSSNYLETWSVTISGTAYTFWRKGYLVKQLWYPTISDDDITSDHTELSTHRPSGIASYQNYRVKAAEKIQRDLLKMGRRPWLIFDAYALVDAHVFETRRRIFLDWATNFGEGRYRELADYYAEQYRDEMASVLFSYDADESSTADESDKVPASSPIVFTAGVPHAGRWYQ